MLKRGAGVLLHISSLPGEYGIGDFGKHGYRFVDFLDKANIKYWQILPLGVTGYGDSPYSSISSYAGNPYFIDLDEFLEKGYITTEELHNTDFGAHEETIDYEKLYNHKLEIIRKAYDHSYNDEGMNLKRFYENNKSWLREFSLYMSLKRYNDNLPWHQWPDEFKYVDSLEVQNFEMAQGQEMGFWIFTQYYFYKQYNRLKEYANNRGIHIIGDVPIYVAEDSADTWANPECFQLDENLRPKTITGTPPDAFSKEGQIWGNPTYDWDFLRESGYGWWIERIKHNFKLYDFLRIDHFRGFDAYWEIPFGSKNGKDGKWTVGPGIALFNKMEEQLGSLNIIAEDLGFYTESLDELLKDTGYPNMKVLQFAFGDEENSTHLPHNYDKNSVVYTGTHDNDPVMAWFENTPHDEIDYAKKYFKIDEKEGYHWGWIRGAWSSVSNIAIAQMQDFLGLSKWSRMNTPGKRENNWTWRMKPSALTDDLALRIRELNEIYKRSLG